MNPKLMTLTAISSVAIPTSLMNIQSSWNNEIILATYQSYISDDIAEEAHKKFNLKTTYFENDKEILRGFKLGTYDLAIVSSSTLEEAINKNIVKQIDWNKFKGISEKYKTKDQEKEKNKFFNDSLFAPVVNKIFEGKPQLANYGIPYFLSYLSFVYRGEKLKDIDSNSTEVSWEKLFQALSQDERFKKDSTKLPKLGLIEDELTIYSLSKLSSGNYFSDTEESEKKKSQEYFFNKYKDLNKKGLNLGKTTNSIFLNSDSALLSEMLLSGQLQGAFMYNGDILYAYKELQGENKTTEIKDFHIYKGTPELWLLDSIAISANISPEREAKVYDFLNELLFKDALDKSTQEPQQASSGDSSYKNSWAWKNFEFLQYTPVLQELQNKLKSKGSGQQTDGAQALNIEEIDDMTKRLLFGASEKNEKDKWCTYESKKTDSKDCSIVFERGLSDTENLNLALAFQQWKNEL